MPADLQARLSSQLGSSFSIGMRTGDGAFTLALPSTLSLDDARAAINRVRMDSTILYANVARPAAAPVNAASLPHVSPPTDRLIVKFRDPARTAAATAGIAPERADLDRLGSVGGVSLAFRRYTATDAAVLTTLRRLPVPDMEAVAKRIAAQPDVEYAQPDYIDQVQLTPNDTCYPTIAAGCGGGYQWDLFDPVAGIDAPAAWNVTTGSAAIRVGIVDTGVLYNHPDLASRFVGGYDMIDDCAVANDGTTVCTFSPLPYNPSIPPSPSTGDRDPDPGDPGDWITAAEDGPCHDTNPASPTYNQVVSCKAGPPAIPSTPPPPYYDWFEGCGASNSLWHGTHVSGTIGAVANNGSGIAGINWVSKIVPMRALGKCGGYVSDIADGIIWAAGGSRPGVPGNPNPVRVINLSLGGFRADKSCDVTYQNAISFALSQNAVVVVSAGNSNYDSAYQAPGNCNGVLLVTAVGQKALKSYYANWGTSVGIAAPGGDMRINAITNQNGYGILSTLNTGAQGPDPNGYVMSQYQGTSMAAPHVTGVASLMLSVNASLTPAQVLAKLQYAARPFPVTGKVCDTTNVPDAGGNGSVPDANWFACDCTTALCGTGLLDAYRAVAIAQPGGAATTTTLRTSGNPLLVGHSVTFTATVSGIRPVGTVTFKDNGSDIPGCVALPLPSGGDAVAVSCTVSLLTGNHPVTAVFNGDPSGNNAASSSTILVERIVTVLPSRARHDFDGNSKDDVLFRETATGNLGIDFMNGAIPTWGPVGGASTAWTIQGVGDFDGNGKGDILFRETATGNLGIYFMNGSVPTWGAVGGASTAWAIQGIGDFDGDGKSDILFRETTTGALGIYFMNGAMPTWAPVGPASTAWTIVGIGDFDGDGRDDILFRENATGNLGIYFMNGASRTWGPVGGSSTAWTVQGVGDFDGDGKADILFRETATGNLGIYFMNGAIPTWGAVGGASTAWSVVQIGDFDGDGKSDILFREGATGNLGIDFMVGATATWGPVGGSSTAWAVQK